MATRIVDYKAGTGATDDTGEVAASAVRPYESTDKIGPAASNRPPENLRKRTETVRNKLEDLHYLMDSDRMWLLMCDELFTFSDTSFVLGAGGSIYLRPALVPKTSTPAKISFGTGAAEVVISTILAPVGPENPPRDYGVYGDATRVSSNKISIEIATGGALSCTVDGTPADNVHITIKSGVTTVTDLVDLLTGNAAFIGLGLTAAPGPTAVGATVLTVATGTLLDARLSGGLDAELHVITAATLAAFFSDPANEMVDGDTLAIWYEDLVRSGDGRRESLADAPESSSNVPVGSLFLVRRFPERAINAIPLVHRTDNPKPAWVWIHGSTVLDGLASVDISHTYVRLSGDNMTGSLDIQGSTTQAALRAYASGVGNYNGLEGVGGPTNGNGVRGVAAGTGAGVRGQGSGGNSDGVQGNGTGSGNGVVGTVSGTGHGVKGTGGAAGYGVQGIGGSAGVRGEGSTNGAGVSGVGGGTGVGVAGTGGVTGAAGVTGTGTVNGAGVVGTGAGTGAGVEGSGSSKGVTGTATAASGIGVTAAANNTNGIGVSANASGTGGRGAVLQGVEYGAVVSGGTAGLDATGLNSDSFGVKGITEDDNGNGAGVYGTTTGASAAPGVLGTSGGGNGAGVVGQGNGTGTGVVGTGGGSGVRDTGAGGANKSGVEGTGNGSGAGVKGVGGGTDGSIGVTGTSAATNGVGVQGTGSGTGNGVTGVAVGTGAGVFGSNTGGGSGVYGQSVSGPSVRAGNNATRGNLYLTPRNNSPPTTPLEGDVYTDSFTNQIYYYDGTQWCPLAMYPMKRFVEATPRCVFAAGVPAASARIGSTASRNGFEIAMTAVVGTPANDIMYVDLPPLQDGEKISKIFLLGIHAYAANNSAYKISVVGQKVSGGIAEVNICSAIFTANGAPGTYHLHQLAVTGETGCTVEDAGGGTYLDLGAAPHTYNQPDYADTGGFHPRLRIEVTDDGSGHTLTLYAVGVEVTR